MIAKGRVEVTVTHPDGKVDAGYYVETLAVGGESEEEAKHYANEFALCTALIYTQPSVYTDMAMDELLPGTVH